MTGGVEDSASPDHEQVFELHRSLLFSITDSILGVAADAEDMLQETFRLWLQIANSGPVNARTFLVTTVARLSAEYMQNKGELKLSPLAAGFCRTASTDPPASKFVSHTFLMMLDRLTPAERVVFLLRTIFDCEYSKIAQTTGKDESECRQIVHQVKRYMIQNRSDLRQASSPEVSQT